MAEVRVYQPGKSRLQQANKANLQQNSPLSSHGLFLYDMLEIVGDQTKREPLEVFEQAMRNATPVLEVKPKRVGGATLQVPVDIKGERRQSLAIRWLLRSARARSGHSMSEKLAAEVM